MADIYDESILRLDMMRKYGLILDLRSGLLKAPHGDIPLQAMETTTVVQRIRNEVDPEQEMQKPCQEILLSEQVEWLKKTLLDHHNVFVQHENDLVRTSLIQHQINTGNHLPTQQAPMHNFSGSYVSLKYELIGNLFSLSDSTGAIRQAPRRVPPTKREEMKSLIESMRGPGVIEPSSSPWPSPVTLVPKNDGTTRFCVLSVAQ